MVARSAKEDRNKEDWLEILLKNGQIRIWPLQPLFQDSAFIGNSIITAFEQYC